MRTPGPVGRTLMASALMVPAATVLSILLAWASAAPGGTAVSSVVGEVAAAPAPGGPLTVRRDGGGDVRVELAAATAVLRTRPGATSLEGAEPITAAAVAVGDRVLAQGTLSEDGTTLRARRVVRRDVVFLRYAPESVRFADARPGAFEDVKPGDQVRVLRTRSADGRRVAAETVVSGSFRVLRGTATAVDPARGTLTVQATGQGAPSVAVAVGPQTLVRRLPPRWWPG